MNYATYNFVIMIDENRIIMAVEILSSENTILDGK